MKCTECGKEHAALIELDGLPICPDCKPKAIQRLAEGAKDKPSSTLFLSRIKACSIDGALLWVINFAAITYFLGAHRKHLPSLNVWFLMVGGFQVVTSCVYEVFLLAQGGATIGKVLCGLEVRGPKGPLTFKQSLNRYCAKILSTFTLGYLTAHGGGPALHDRLAGTRVVSLRTDEPQVPSTCMTLGTLAMIIPAIWFSVPLPPFSAFGYIGYWLIYFLDNHVVARLVHLV